MTTALISVVLPTYNRAHLLAQAIQSVLAQSHTHLELIIVDDNSPDDTAEVVRRFDDRRVRYVRNEPNLKLPRALNRGFALARGEYLTWTSDDNLYAPEALAKMKRALDDASADFVYADYWQFSAQDAAGVPLSPQIDRLPDMLRLEKGNHIGACFLYTRRLYEAIGEYDPELFLVEDYDYFLRASRQFRFCHLPEPLYYFRRDEATLYISRYAEVKTSDILVRFKNDLLSIEEAADVLVDLLLQNPDHLENPTLRRALSIRERLSYRVGNWLTQRGLRSLRQSLAKAIAPLFTGFRNGVATFGETRAALLALANRYGRLAYPKTRKA